MNTERSFESNHCRSLLSYRPVYMASECWDNTVGLWHLAKGASQFTLKGLSRVVAALIFSPGGQLLASTANDKTIKL